ncbi:MAG: MerR family transcriptional regulator, partial [Candidatus Levybacteria bacterium]|nr:MerR family transcriptional regulator [Candidatus Levybacteria bacterium]
MSSLPNNNKWVSLGQAAEILSVPIATVRRWDKEGILHSSRSKENICYFLIEELENIRLTEMLSISQAARLLGISDSALLQFEEKSLIASWRNLHGEPFYLKKSLDSFQNIILDPLRGTPQAVPATPIKVLTVYEENPSPFGTLSSDKKNIFQKFMAFQKVFYTCVLFVLMQIILLVGVLTILFLLFPENTVKFLGYHSRDASTVAKQYLDTPASSKVLGIQIQQDEDVSMLGKILTPFSNVSLLIVKQLDEETYYKIVPRNAVKSPDSSFLKTSERDIIEKIKAEILQDAIFLRNNNESTLRDEDGFNRVISSLNILNGTILAADLASGAVTTLAIADQAVTAAKLSPELTLLEDNAVLTQYIKDGEVRTEDILDGTLSNSDIADDAAISDGKLAQITASNKVAGSAVQLNANGGLVNNAGLSMNIYSGGGIAVSSDGVSLLLSCANGDVLKWNTTTSVWECSATAGGGSAGITAIKENDADVVSSATIIDFLGSDFTVTDAPSGEGNVSIDYSNSGITRRNQNETVSGSWTFSSAAPLQFSSTNPSISIGNTGALSITDGSNTLLSVTDNGTTGNAVITGTINSATISGGALTATAVNGITTANITTQGNTFNGASQLVQLDNQGKLPAFDGSLLTALSKSQIGLGNVENTALSTWSGSTNLVTAGTLTSGATGTGFTLNFTNSSLSGNITGSNIDESSLSGITTSNFTSANISQWTNNAGYITSNQSITLSGAVSGTGTTTITTTLEDDAVTTDKIQDDAITLAKIGQNSCIDNQIIKWSGTSWACATDQTGAGGSYVSLNPASADSATGTGPGLWINHGGTGSLLRLQNGGGTPVDRFVISNSGIITTGGYQGAVIADTYVSDDITISSSGSVAAGALTGTINTARITGLSPTQFTSANISQWTNDAGYLSTVDISSNTNLSASDGIALTGDALTNTDKGSSQNIFKSIAVSGQSNVVADGNTDTLTLIAGTNVTLATDATNDSITINATDTNTTYTAGSDLDLTGTTFDLESTIDTVSTINLSGTGTLNGLDAIDATTETTLESAIDTLANLTAASSLVSVGTLTGGGTGTGFTLNFTNSTLSGNISGSNIDESTLSGLTASNFSSANISQWTNNAGYITDGNTGWDNSYGFITASSTDTLTNKSGNISQWTNDAGYITDGNTGWDNAYGFITASSTDTFTNKSGNISQWTNNSGYLSTVDVSSNTNLTASDGISLTGDALANTDKGSSQNIFKNIAVSGQTNVVTDSNSDTLTFIAGTNITLTTDATGDTITINGSGGGTTYSAGNDLDLVGTTFDLESTLDSVDTINLAGTGTLNGLDVIDATSETTIEGAIDTLG